MTNFAPSREKGKHAPECSCTPCLLDELEHEAEFLADAVCEARDMPSIDSLLEVGTSIARIARIGAVLDQIPKVRLRHADGCLCASCCDDEVMALFDPDKSGGDA